MGESPLFALDKNFILDLDSSPERIDKSLIINELDRVQQIPARTEIDAIVLKPIKEVARQVKTNVWRGMVDQAGLEQLCCKMRDEISAMLGGSTYAHCYKPTINDTSLLFHSSPEITNVIWKSFTDFCLYPYDIKSNLNDSQRFFANYLLDLRLTFVRGDMSNIKQHAGDKFHLLQAKVFSNMFRQRFQQLAGHFGGDLYNNVVCQNISVIAMYVYSEPKSREEA